MTQDFFIEGWDESIAPSRSFWTLISPAEKRFQWVFHKPIIDILNESDLSEVLEEDSEIPK